MQRQETEGVVISCDFCGSDWDPYDTGFARPMVEGHRGSVICLDCLKRALEEWLPAAEAFSCTLCLNEDLKSGVKCWKHPVPQPSPGLKPDARACESCLKQAARRFSKDPDIDWVWEQKK